eukprot:gnl/Trimastix_PCT/30.p1 GENE.gnl/Trimastix_PCT/30~~gnl/Trimastix_PCT/30.p1  ORF type:complete len:152 (-),score=0.37 gnl/Trimastix_PCT/30:200-655(-)
MPRRMGSDLKSKGKNPKTRNKRSPDAREEDRFIGGSKTQASLDDRVSNRTDTGPELGALLGDGASHLGALGFALGVDNDTGIVLEVHEHAVTAAERLPLTDDNGGHDLLAEVGLTLLDGAHDHVANAGGRETVQTTLDTFAIRASISQHVR